MTETRHTASTEPTPDWEFRESLLLLLSQAQRGRLTTADADLLRSHVEHLLRHLDGADNVARRLQGQRQEMAAERYAWQERGDKAEAERDRYAAALDRVRLVAGTPDPNPPGDTARGYATAMAAVLAALDGNREPEHT